MKTAFKPLVREAKFDVGELAIVTFLQAKTYGKPYVLIPATVLGRGQHHIIAYNPERGELQLLPKADPSKVLGRRTVRRLHLRFELDIAAAFRNDNQSFSYSILAQCLLMALSKFARAVAEGPLLAVKRPLEYTRPCCHERHAQRHRPGQRTPRGG